MSIVYKGTNGADTYRQSNYQNSSRDDIFTYGGNDKIILDLIGYYGGHNYVEAGSGNDTVINYYEGGNDIFLGTGDDTYTGNGLSSRPARYDIVSGGFGEDTFNIRTRYSEYYGDEDNDTFNSIGLSNSLYGGSGRDLVSYKLQDSEPGLKGLGVTVDLAANYASTGGGREEYLHNIENVEGTSYADDLLGDGAANTISGLGGRDILDGRIGNDSLSGGKGADDLYGGGGNDELNGGHGNDLLFGGAGADRFVFVSPADSVVGARRDVIKDFSSAQSDRIDLSGIDANASTMGDDAFTFVGNAAFSGVAGELRFASHILSGDIDGDSVADFQIRVTDVASLAVGDFIL
jgi:Ca2+-binding RTX toxin-like protein